jgi:hypothetical protein
MLGKSMLYVVGNIRVTDVQIYEHVTLYALIQIQKIVISTTCNSVIYPGPHISSVIDWNIKLYIKDCA